MDITIRLPEKINLLITSNQDVDFDTMLYEIAESDEIKIPLAQKLNIKPDKIFKYLKKFVGEEINKGDVLAIKKNLFSDMKYISDFSGIIKEINHELGEIIIQARTDQKKQKKSFFKGKVSNIKDDNLTINISSNALSFSLKKALEDFGGEVVYLKNSDTTNLTEKDVKNKILFCETLNSYLQSKFEALGASGFISLKSLTSESNISQAKIKNAEDFSKIINYNFHYCLIAKNDSLVHFYND